jgi:hypothetical protein
VTPDFGDCFFFGFFSRTWSGTPSGLDLASGGRSNSTFFLSHLLSMLMLIYPANTDIFFCFFDSVGSLVWGDFFDRDIAFALLDG